MRTDMKKVLTERPRHGHIRSYHEIRARETRKNYDDLPAEEGIRRPYCSWTERKEFSDLIGPLKRFLWSCRGRRWDEVWSEICGQLSNNTTGAHLKGHVLSEVEVHTYLDGDEVRCRGRYHFGTRLVSGLYVHPVTGVLCGNPERIHYRGAREPEAKCFVDGISYRKGDDGVLRPRINWATSHLYGKVIYSRKIIGPEREAVYIAGFWYWVIFASVPAPDVIVLENGDKRILNHVGIDLVTGREVREGRYRADKRQMGGPDMRRYGLVNE